MKNHVIQSFLFMLLMGGWISATAQQDPTVQVTSTLDQQLAQLPATSTDDLKPGTSRFLLRGYAHSGLEATKDDVSFVGGSFNPILLFRQSDRLLFESELEIELEDNEVHLGLEYANISYLLNKSVTLRVGKTLTPFAIFIPNLHPAWINKFPSRPLGAGHGGVLPTADIGAELRGAAFLGNMKTNYSVYVVNGPQLNDGSVEAEEGGLLHFDRVPDNNKGKTVGGRFGFFPLSSSALEIGFSGQIGKVGAKDSKYKDIAARLYGIDLSYVHNLTGISSVLDIKGQFAVSDVDKAEYPDEDNPDELITFDNHSSAWFAQLSLRPAMIDDNFFRNLEFAGRFSKLKTPDGALWGADQEQWELGLNYWLDWRTLFKFSYRIVSGDGAPADTFFLHWAIGF